MRLVYRVGEYRLSLGLQSMLPWWDMRLCIMADPSITNTAIEWFRNMWNTIPGGGEDVTFNLNTSSWYLAAVDTSSTSPDSYVGTERFYTANIDKMYVFGRHEAEGENGYNTIGGNTTIQMNRGSAFVRVIFAWGHPHSIRIQTMASVYDPLITTDLTVDIDPATWYRLYVGIDGTEVVAQVGTAYELRASIPSTWLASTAMQENRLSNSVDARRGPVSIDNAVIRLWVDAPIYHDATADTWTLDDTDTESIVGTPSGDYTAATSTLQSAPTPFVISGGGGEAPPDIEGFRLNSLDQCPMLRGWLGATEIIVYGHIYA